jgi:hypothetical protein
MLFQFTKNEAVLTRPVTQSGFGLTQTDLNAVTVWQKDFSYSFNFHSAMHGDMCVYTTSTGKGRNLPCIWLEGSNRLGTRGSVPADAKSVVTANVNAFLKMARAYNSAGEEEATGEAAEAAPALIQCKCGAKFVKPATTDQLVPCPKGCGRQVWIGT